MVVNSQSNFYEIAVGYALEVESTNYAGGEYSYVLVTLPSEIGLTGTTTYDPFLESDEAGVTVVSNTIRIEYKTPDTQAGLTLHIQNLVNPVSIYIYIYI